MNNSQNNNGAAAAATATTPSMEPSTEVSTAWPWAVKLENFPEQLRDKLAWCIWRYEAREGKPTKVPCQPCGAFAKSNDPATWVSFAEACAAADADPEYGVGIFCDGTFTFVDVDHCRDASTGALEPWAQRVLNRVGGYQELSPSHTGLHAFVDGAVSVAVKKNGVEMYSRGRFATVTGQGSGTFAPCAMLEQIRTDVAAGKMGKGTITAVKSHSGLTLEQLENGASPNDDASEGDYQYVAMLAEDGLSDEEIDARFCASARMRDKWDRNAGGGQSYGERTIAKVRAVQAAESKQTGGDAELINAQWFFPVGEFLMKKLPLRKVLVSSEGQPLFYQKSLNEIYAFRGNGKSMFKDPLINILIHGGEFLRYKSEGGNSVLLVDGELPGEQLQERLKQYAFVKPEDRMFWYMSPENLPHNVFPPLSNPVYQQIFLDKLEAINPDVIIFDTLTACFKHDTNDTEADQRVNQFLMQLRFRGHCVIFLHHAGKQGLQRGRTDVEDDLDIVIKLERPQDWSPADGLRANVVYEKVRHNAFLEDYTAELDRTSGKWGIVEDVETTKQATALLLAGKSTRQVADKTGISQTTAARLRRKLLGTEAKLTAEVEEAAATIKRAEEEKRQAAGAKAAATRAKKAAVKAQDAIADAAFEASMAAGRAEALVKDAGGEGALLTRKLDTLDLDVA